MVIMAHLLPLACSFTLVSLLYTCTAFSVPRLTSRSSLLQTTRTDRSIRKHLQECSRYSPYHSHDQHLNRDRSLPVSPSALKLSAAVSANEDLLPGIALIDENNDIIADQMNDLRQSPYFRLFCVDILASCEYMPQELFECYSETCEVYPVDDDQVR
jgi:hypothetical protein